MPRAVTSREPERFDLKSLPKGFVTLRKLTYGETLRRRELSGGMTAQTGRRSRDATSDITMKMNWNEVQFFEFSHCIVDHNLEDEKDVKLDLTTREGVQSLDPVVAMEIEELIDRLNNPPTEEEDKFLPRTGLQVAVTQDGDTEVDS